MPCALRISEAASLGMHAMGLLSTRESQPMSARMAADRLGVSEAHLSKVLQRLKKVAELGVRQAPKLAAHSTDQRLMLRPDCLVWM